MKVSPLLEKIRDRVSRHPLFITALFFSLLLLFRVGIPYFLHNNLLYWDSSGHTFQAWHLKNNLFPRFLGWNPFFYAGYPQGMFYPPLLSYLAALTAFVVPLAAGLKFWMVLSLVLFPFAAAWYAGGLKMRPGEKVCVLALIFVAFATGGHGGGGTLHSFLIVGDLAGFLALPLVFIFAGCLARSLDSPARVAPAVLVLALMFTAHLVATAAALVLLAATVLFFAGSKKHLWGLLKIALLAHLLTAFWWYPMFEWRSILRSVCYPMIANLGTTLCTFAALLTLFLSRRMKNSDSAALSSLHALSLVTAGLTMPLLLPGIDFHYYRLQIFVIYFSAPAFVHLFGYLAGKDAAYSKLAWTLAAFSVVLFFNLKYNPSGLESPRMPTLSFPGRVLGVWNVHALNRESIALEHQLALQQSQPGISGLFVESALNGPYVMSLRNALPTPQMVWGADPESLPAGSGLSRPGDLKEVFRLFNITNLIASRRQPGNAPLFSEGPPGRLVHYQMLLEDEVFADILEKKVREFTPRYIYNYPTGVTPAWAEVPAQKIRAAAGGNWYKEVYDWWISPSAIKEELLVDTFGREIAFIPPSGKEKIEFQPLDGAWENFSLKISGTRGPAPVLVKQSFFPFWEARFEGRPVPIFRASPELMFVVAPGDGEILFRFNPFPPSVRRGYWISALGAVLLLLEILFTFKNKNRV